MVALGSASGQSGFHAPEEYHFAYWNVSLHNEQLHDVKRPRCSISVTD